MRIINTPKRFVKLKGLGLICCIISLLLNVVSGCQSRDKLNEAERDSVRAFGEIIEVLPVEEYGQKRWKLTASDGSAWFAFDNMGVEMVVDAGSFISAGADQTKLDTNEHVLNPGRKSITFTTAGTDMLNKNVKDLPLEQFEYNISCLNDYTGYNSETGRYYIDYGNGNYFEWARDMSANREDIVFILNPDPIIEAGVNPEAVEGWTYDQIAVTEKGKTKKAYKFIKSIDLK